MPDAEITVQFLGTNKKNAKYGYIKSAEGDTYGCLAEQLKQFSTGQLYTIQFHTNDRGYKEFDAIKSKPPVKQNIRPATNPRDSDRMGTMGMVNAVLNGMSYGRPIDDILATPKGKIAKLIDFLNDELHMTRMHGGEVQSRDDMNDRIDFL